MNANPQAIAAMSAITISREYGSGGGEIAARLAHRLGRDSHPANREELL
jgi:CMP/dCMP kinase